MTPTTLTLLIVLACIVTANSYLMQRQLWRNSRLWYDYFKKGPEKKEIGRLWKNIIFPGIYVEYADTKETKETVKIETKYKQDDFRNDGIVTNNLGTYQEVDPSSAPKLVSADRVKTTTMKPIARPAGFVAPTPKKSITAKATVSVLPNISKFPRPRKPLIIYEYEASPDCKAVRSACSLLDLTVEYRPCPGARAGFSDLMTTITAGRRDVPFIVDPNPSMFRPEIFGRKEIVEYLFKTYGPGIDAIPSTLKGGSSFGAGLFTGGGKGSRLRSNARSDITLLKPITLYGWEGENQFVRPVRETLTELGLAHIFVNCATGSANRAKLTQKTGLFQVPYISDPNTGVEMFESQQIVKYLETVYTK